jgi:tyrosyl-tRNA synthetase
VIDAAEIGIAALLKQCGLVPSTSQAFRLIEQGGIRLNGEKVTNTKATVTAGGTYLFQVGKRLFVEVSVTRTPTS